LGRKFSIIAPLVALFICYNNRMFIRTWAFFRRIQYAALFLLLIVLFGGLVYRHYLYVAPSCFDNKQNGTERGVDCDGSCNRICAFDVNTPQVLWARSFRVTEGQYNAVAYVENKNTVAAAPQVTYTFSLYDAQGLITERKGTTILPPDSVYPIFEGRIATGNRIPTQTFITIDPIDLWLPATVGRNQFTVTDRTLKDADAQPKLEAKIRNNELTPAKNVEVVATIFDSHGNALTSSRTVLDSVPARSEASAVFTWAEPIAGTLRSCEVPTDVLLAIDLSGSMDNDSKTPPQPLTSVLLAAQSFVSRLRASDQAGIITFATKANTAQPLTHSLEQVSGEITKLSIDPKEQNGNTNTGDALVSALTEMQSSDHSTQARKVVVLLTDGLATAPDKDPEGYALQQAQALKDAGVIVYAIGLGEQVNMDFIKQLASSPALAYQAVGASDIDLIYQQITSSLCEDGPTVIDIVPKTDTNFAPLQ
jgi:Mg-chelatase subunit ChlD